MTQTNFSGHGTDSLENIVGRGQGLQVGITKLEFASGKIQLVTATSSNTLIGKFKTFQNLDAVENTVRSFAFKSAVKCTLVFQNTFIEYNLINEWIILNGIQTELIEIIRAPSGLSVDIFDWAFIASDDPLYKISIEKGTRDSDLETVFPSVSRAHNGGAGSDGIYTQNINVQGADEIILIGKGTSGAGTAKITLEIFDPASDEWIQEASEYDIFTLNNATFLKASLGMGHTKKIVAGQGHGAITKPVGATGQVDVVPEGSTVADADGVGGLVRYDEHSIPSGDSILRVKATVETAPLTFSVGLIKVFHK